MNALGINEVDNDVLSDADQYLREHKILELFEVSVEPHQSIAFLSFHKLSGHGEIDLSVMTLSNEFLSVF